MRRNINGEFREPFSRPLTAEQLTRSVKGRFVGEPSKTSPKRTEMQELGALAAAEMPLQELLPLGEPVVDSQIAVITPPEIENLLLQTDELIAAGNLSPEDVTAAMEAAQAGGLTTIDATADNLTTSVNQSGREFIFPLVHRKEWRRLVGVFVALLFILAIATTACAADNSASLNATQLTGQPTFFVDAPQPPVLGGGEGETPAPAEVEAQQICVFDSARNLRTGPSATAAKTTLDGSGATVAGKEYQCFEKIENADGSVWVRISEQPKVWAVLEHPVLGLTGTVQQEAPAAETATIETRTPITITNAAETSTPFDLETQQTLIKEYNKIAVDLRLETAQTIIQAVDESILYLDQNGQLVAISRQMEGATGEVITRQLFAIDPAGDVSKMVIAENSGNGWKAVDNADLAVHAEPDAAAINSSPALTETETIGPTQSLESGIATFITEALQAQSPEQEAMNNLLPANFAEKLQERGVTSITFDTASSLYHVVDKDGQQFYFVPQAASSAEGDGLADFESGFFMGTADSWMHLKAGQAALNVLFLVDPSDKVLDGPLTLVDELTSGKENELATTVLKVLGVNPDVKKIITVVIAQSGMELTALTPPDQREGELPNVLKSNDSRQRVFVVGPDKYVSIGYMLRAGSTEGETYINLLKNYIAQGAPDEYIVNAILLARYISRHLTLLFDTFADTGIPSNPNDLLDPLRALVRDGQDGYKAAATAPLNPRPEIASWLK